MPAYSPAYAMPALQEPSRPQAPPPMSSSELARGRALQRSLSALLDTVPRSRSALPHLAAFESGLSKHGMHAIQKASPRGLQKIHTQLRVLPLDPHDTVIQDLLARIQNALRRHASRLTTHEAQFDPEATMVITEVSHSAFMDALEESSSGGQAKVSQGVSAADTRPATALAPAAPRQMPMPVPSATRSGPPPGIVPVELRSAIN